MSASFGRPGSVTRASLAPLADPMKREGILLLFEMGASLTRVSEITGWSRQTIRDLLAREAVFRHESQNSTGEAK